jgi:hypothetical protein
MTVLALRLSRRANAVSSLHGEVSRAMWTSLLQEVLQALDQGVGVDAESCAKYGVGLIDQRKVALQFVDDAAV